MRTDPTLKLAAAAGFFAFGLLFAASATADTLLGPDDFESGFGSWTNATGDVFDWTRNSGGTTSSNTGPSGDHTSGSGYYLFTEASSPQAEGDAAILESPCIDLTGASEADLDFWYHMYGAGMGTLEVQVASSTGASCASLGGHASAFSVSGNQGDLWTAANVSLDPYTGGSIQIRIIGVVGSSYQSDMAIDDVEVTATSTSAGGEADYVIHVSVDGLASYLLETRIDSAGYENFKRFVTEGATSFDARSDYTHTWTMPAHVSMVTGRPVLQPAAQPNTVHHGYTDNGDPDPGWTLHDSQWNPNVPYIASAWDVAHDNGLVTALYASKSKFVIFEQSYDSDSGAPDTTGPDDGTDKIDYYVIRGDDVLGPFRPRRVRDAPGLHRRHGDPPLQLHLSRLPRSRYLRSRVRLGVDAVGRRGEARRRLPGRHLQPDRDRPAAERAHGGDRHGRPRRHRNGTRQRDPAGGIQAPSLRVGCRRRRRRRPLRHEPAQPAGTRCRYPAGRRPRGPARLRRRAPADSDRRLRQSRPPPPRPGRRFPGPASTTTRTCMPR